jgi:NAD(P)-dependent dehydrogenase (short-subunit alcohol dehydrogenase family)
MSAVRRIDFLAGRISRMVGRSPGVRTVFVTGANRGLGLEIIKQLLERGEKVLGACRAPAAATELHGLAERHPGRLEIIELDLTRPESIAAAGASARGRTAKIDLLFNVAGTKGNLGPDPARDLSRVFGEIEAGSMAGIFAVNATGPLLLVQALRALLPGAVVINITSSMGSNGLMNRGDWYGYRASKAALNIISRALSFDLRGEGTIVVAMHPGWVKTAMGTDDAPYPLEASVTSLLGVVDRLRPEDSGKYVNWRGEELPW